MFSLLLSIITLLLDTTRFPQRVSNKIRDVKQLIVLPADYQGVMNVQCQTEYPGAKNSLHSETERVLRLTSCRSCLILFLTGFTGWTGFFIPFLSRLSGLSRPASFFKHRDPYECGTQTGKPPGASVARQGYFLLTCGGLISAGDCDMVNSYALLSYELITLTIWMVLFSDQSPILSRLDKPIQV